jgi:hypothetical protein
MCEGLRDRRILPARDRTDVPITLTITIIGGVCDATGPGLNVPRNHIAIVAIELLSKGQRPEHEQVRTEEVITCKRGSFDELLGSFRVRQGPGGRRQYHKLDCSIAAPDGWLRGWSIGQ